VKPVKSVAKNSSRLRGKSAKRAGIQNQIPKKIKKFSPFLTLYFTITYDLSSCPFVPSW
jgi:hypothetical protein